MLASLLLILVALFLIFYRDILAILAQNYWRPKKMELQPVQALELQSQKQKIPQVWICPKSKITVESLSINGIFQNHIFVSEDFWKQLDSSNQDTLIIWHYSAMKSQSFLNRVLRNSSASSVDRHCLLWGSASIVLIELLEKANAFAGLQTKISILRGLSLMATPFFMGPPEMKARIQKINSEATRLKLAESL